MELDSHPRRKPRWDLAEAPLWVKTFTWAGTLLSLAGFLFVAAAMLGLFEFTLPPPAEGTIVLCGIAMGPATPELPAGLVTGFLMSGFGAATNVIAYLGDRTTRRTRE